MNILLISLLLYVALMIAIAFFFSYRRKKTARSDFMSEYFLASRSMNGFVLAMTVSATYISASSFIGGPGAAYNYGLGWVFLAMIQVPVAFFTLGLLGKKVAHCAKKYQLITVNDLLFHQYRSQAVVLLSSFALIVSFFIMMVVQFYGAGRLLEITLDIPYQQGVMIFALTVILYTFIGGFRMVVLTDAIQGVIMIIGAVLLLGGIIYSAGGLSLAIDRLIEINPQLISPYGIDARPLTFDFMLSFWFLVCIGIIAMPAMLVRSMAYKDNKSLHQGIILSTIVVSFLLLTMHLSGVLGRAVLDDVSIPDQVIPLLMVKTLPPVVAGMFLAAPMAAIMSSVDSLLIQSGSILVKDIIIRLHPALLGRERVIKQITFAVVLIFTALLLISSFDPPPMLVWLNLHALGFIEAVFFWTIIAGFFYKKANAGGALCSMLAGALSYALLTHYSISLLSFHTVIASTIISGIGFAIGNLLAHKGR